MLADWVLAAAPGFDGDEDGDHEFQALPRRMTEVCVESLRIAHSSAA